MHEITQVYAADITKAERDADGNLNVYGKATGPDLDLDLQRCDPGWLKRAMPDWMAWGNVREMHQPVVAGIGVELSEDNDSWFLKSRVIDPGVAAKMEAGAYKGYSIGIKDVKTVKSADAPKGMIVGGTIVEVSYVDRPCNPESTLSLVKMAGGELTPVDAEGELAVEPEPTSKFTLSDEDVERIAAVVVKALRPDDGQELSPEYKAAEADIYKRDVSTAERKELARRGDALADGSYPIANEEDLHNAASLVKSRHGDWQAAERLIAKRAKELGVPNPLDKDVVPDATKTPAADEPQADERVESLTKMVSALTEAKDVSEERFKALEAELAKVLATPIPGAPLQTVPAAMRVQRETDNRKAEAARLRKLASEIGEKDIASSYRKRADELDALGS